MSRREKMSVNLTLEDVQCSCEGNSYMDRTRLSSLGISPPAFEGFFLLPYLVALSRMRSCWLEGTQSTAVDGERMVVSSRPVETPGATTRRIRVKFSLLIF
jgi:hypothetical protein